MNNIKQQAFETLCEHIDYKHLKNNCLNFLVIALYERLGRKQFTCLDEENGILRNNYKATGVTPEDIIDMTGTLIDDKIKSIIHDDSHFPIFSDLEN